MPIHFSLDSKVNKRGECSIRFSWTYRNERYQTTTGFTIANGCWNSDTERVNPDVSNASGQTAECINSELDNLSALAGVMEARSISTHFSLSRNMMMAAARDLKSGDYLSAEEIADYIFEDIKQSARIFGNNINLDSDKKYYQDDEGRYYVGVCSALGWTDKVSYVVFRELNGRGLTYVLPAKKFFKTRSIHGRKVSVFEPVSIDRALDRTKQSKNSSHS